MSASTRSLLQPGPGAMHARRRLAPARSHLAEFWRQAGPRLGLLFVLLASTAHASDSEQRAQEARHHPVLDSSAVPTAANWVVLDAVGAAAWRAQDENRWREFKRGEVLPQGCEIETGSDGEVTLVAGGDQLIVAPHGRLLVPPAASDQDRRLRQERGRILVHIEPRKDRDVRVYTPLLSLGIKGTTFEVNVDPEQNSVFVHDGEVEVTTPDQAEPVELGAGEGLRQPAAPGERTARFASPERDAPFSPVTDLSPRPSATEDGAAVDAPTDVWPGPHADTPAGVPFHSSSERSGQPASAPPHTQRPLGWVDDLASSWASVAIVGVALLFLTIPLLALVQNLRERWLSRPGARGRRRRQLIRD